MIFLQLQLPLGHFELLEVEVEVEVDGEVSDEVCLIMLKLGEYHIPCGLQHFPQYMEIEEKRGCMLHKQMISVSM